MNVIGRSSFDRAMMTARSYPPDVDELDAIALRNAHARRVAPPRIMNALGWIEAVLDREVS